MAKEPQAKNITKQSVTGFENLNTLNKIQKIIINIFADKDFLNLFTDKKKIK
jgi:hypothetical protein